MHQLDLNEKMQVSKENHLRSTKTGKEIVMTTNLEDTQKNLMTTPKVNNEVKDVTLFNNITNDKDNVTVKVRILHLWETLFMNKATNKKEVSSMEMIIMDEEGNKMQARAMSRFIKSFKKDLKVDTTYYFKDVSLASVSKTLKFYPTKHSQKISFAIGSSIAQCQDFSLNNYGFNFVEFSSIYAREFREDQACDVIGIIHQFDKMNKTDKDEARHRITITLQNQEGTLLEVTLFGSRVYEMNDFLKQHPNKQHAVLIIQIGKVSFYRGKPTATSYYDNSRVFIDADLEEAKTFRDLFITKRNSESSSGSMCFKSRNSYCERSDFLTDNDFKKIVDIPPPVKDTKFIVVAEIIGIRADQGWYFYACNLDGCYSTTKEVIEPSDGFDENGAILPPKTYYKCYNPNHKDIFVPVVPRYKITVNLQDSSGSRNCIMFERDAYKLLQTKCSVMYAKYVKNGNLLEKPYPGEINNMKGRFLAFKVGYTKYNLDGKGDALGIFSISKNDTIITDLLKEHQDVQPSASASDSMSSGNKVSPVALKESVSQTGDNITPILVHSTATSPVKELSTTSDLKRKLDNYYDEDETGNLSASKPNEISPSESAKVPLKIPKIEK